MRQNIIWKKAIVKLVMDKIRQQTYAETHVEEHILSNKIK